jgi:hypothetical protein
VTADLLPPLCVRRAVEAEGTAKSSEEVSQLVWPLLSRPWKLFENDRLIDEDNDCVCDLSKKEGPE